MLLKINPINPDLGIIEKARDYIIDGKLVVFPTDTVYGLATDPFNENAVKNLIKVKKRDYSKGLPVLIANIEIAKEFVEFSKVANSIASQFWPGALTLILPLKKPLPYQVTGYRNSLGIRIPNHDVARRLAKIPIIGTSANISGQKSPVTAEEAMKQLGDAIHLVLDSGPIEKGLPSTILDLSENEPKFLREGAIKYSELWSFLR
ncbi:MAG: L-threonylcarbamoyladenylate synthase [Promethearchaeota archaeon]